VIRVRAGKSQRKTELSRPTVYKYVADMVLPIYEEEAREESLQFSYQYPGEMWQFL
jgi:ACT domain-containing protein